jgi:hypothetical protein
LRPNIEFSCPADQSLAAAVSPTKGISFPT